MATCMKPRGRAWGICVQAVIGVKECWVGRGRGRLRFVRTLPFEQVKHAVPFPWRPG